MNKLYAAMILMLGMAVSPEVSARIEQVTVDPPPPICADEVTLSVEGHFSDVRVGPPAVLGTTDDRGTAGG